MIYRALRTSRPLAAFLLGLAGTLLILIAFWTGLDPRTELIALDMRFGLTDAPLPNDILHVNIDDGSLEDIGRWPWHRQKLAAIIDVLKECGAKAVMVDLIFSDPQELRFEAPAYEVYAGGDQEILSQNLAQPIFDDTILATSLAEAGNVFLTMHVDTEAGESATTEAYDAMSQLMSDNPHADLQTVLKGVSGSRKSAIKSYLHHRSLVATERFSIPADSIGVMNVPSGRVTPPLVSFAQQAAGIGCVNSVRDPDKLVRRSPLFFRGRGGIYPQFAFSLVMNELASRHGGIVSMRGDESSFTIKCKDGTERMIPLDRDGFMVIRWPRQAINSPTYGVDNISAAETVGIWRIKNSRRINANRIQGLRVRFIHMGKQLPDDEEIKSLYHDGYVEDSKLFDFAYTERLAAEQKLRMTSLYAPSRIPDTTLLEKLRLKEKNIQQRLESNLGALVEKLRKPGNLEIFLGKPQSSSTTQPADNSPEQQAFVKAMTKAKELHAMETELHRANLESEKEIRILMDRLRPQIANRICLLGATGTGVPDFVPTPLGPKTPGVFVHSNIINTILSGAFVYPAGMLANTLTILLAGILVSFLAATRPILQAAPLSLLAAIGYAVFNTFVVFAWWGIWLAFVAPLGAMLLTFLFVTAFRQLTEERAKRHIRGMWAQSLSPALVEQILKNPEMVNLGGQNTELTCMFSDLAGFTPLSESLGPQKTVALLNRYFDGVTDIVQTRCEGYLNKFLGDGVFVLFGVPIKMDDHPSRAIDAALLCQAEVARLNEALAEELGGEVKLKVRIGLHGGGAIFGNCGSTEKTDYTAIGDCVNLSARLESANKFFGTRIIVSEHTWNLCDRDDLLVRPLGNVFITGVRDSLNILEVIGPVEEVGESHSKAVSHFAQAMDMISHRKFPEARTQLQQADQLHPDDTPTKLYLDICSHCIGWGSEINAWPVECETAGGVVRLAWPENV
ncbi:MAG: CHASE2 domain-containing protein [Phycisphaerae bacterium]|jgi:class 3 adenylate cyclase|nr:CHASE2 domain-containing protein [Phycisphaerae bacterium]